MTNRLAGVLAILAILLVTSAVMGGAVVAQTKPEFRLGFKAFADQIPDVVGQPLEDEHWGANGDSLQQTTNGLMVWRKADNWTAFTNGSRTWINGPVGVQSRANDERFDWEGISEEEAGHILLNLPEVQALAAKIRAQGARVALQFFSRPSAIAKPGTGESRFGIFLRDVTEQTMTRLDTFWVDAHTGEVFVDTLWGTPVPLEQARATGWRSEWRPRSTPTPSPTRTPLPTQVVPSVTPTPDLADQRLRADIAGTITALNSYADHIGSDYYRQNALNAFGRLKARSQLGTSDLAAKVRDTLPGIESAVSTANADAMRLWAVRLEAY